MSAQPGRPLQVGLLNMMADGALRATERQFTRLLGAEGSGAGVGLTIFSLPELERSAQARAHIAACYVPFAQVQRQGLDALVITGVNLSDPRLELQTFWEPLIRVFTWAEQEVPAVLCSCLASHAVLQFHCGQRRTPLGAKLWGVFEQEVTGGHPLTTGLPARMAVPHSRHNDVTGDQMRAAGLQVLVQGGGAGAHLAARPDLRLVVMQGHPEYDAVSLLKEYRREVGRWRQGLRPDHPPLPENYLDEAGCAVLADFRRRLQADPGQDLEFSEHLLLPSLRDRWSGPAAQFFANWLAVAARLGT